MADGTEGELRILVSQAVDGDADAWERPCPGPSPRHFAYSRRRGSEHEADDVVSETMLRALNRIAGFTWQGAGFDAWLYGIARNVVQEAHRHSGRVSSSAADPADTETAAAGPLEELVGRERCADVRSAFGRLSPEDQEVLELRASAGGAGEVLGRRPGAVRMAQSRALGRFRGFFEEVSGAY